MLGSPPSCTKSLANRGRPCMVLRHEGPHRSECRLGPGAHGARHYRQRQRRGRNQQPCCTVKKLKPGATLATRGLPSGLMHKTACAGTSPCTSENAGRWTRTSVANELRDAVSRQIQLEPGVSITYWGQFESDGPTAVDKSKLHARARSNASGLIHPDCCECSASPCGRLNGHS